MANGEQSQTDPVGSGDEQNQDVEDIKTQSSKKTSIPDNVFDDSGIIQFLQNIHPKYKGWNGARLRSELIKDDKLLNEFADRIMVDTMEQDENLRLSLQEDPELYKEHRSKIKDSIEFQLTNDTLKGETSKQSIVNRTYELRNNDLSSFKRSAPEFEHESLVRQEARKHGIDPEFAMSVIEQESGFKHDSVSDKGAIGYMQLMPETAKELGVDPHDPEENIIGGIEYLAKQVKDFKSVQLGLAAYNAGPGTVKEKGGIPNYDETLTYVESIIGNYQKHKQKRFTFDAPVSAYKKIAEENPDKYRELGIVNGEGRFKYDGEAGNKTFLTKLRENEELQKTLISDRYETFVDDLADSHNTGAIDESNVDDMARAWSVYDQFGQEGLTRYLNVEEHYQEGVPLEEQPRSVQEGIQYLQNTEKDGFRPADYVKTFFGREDSPVGRFEVTPITQSRELQEEVDKDLNNWTRFFKAGDNADEGIKNLIDQSRRRQDGADTDTFLDEYGKYIPFGHSKGLNNVVEAYKNEGFGPGTGQLALEGFSAVAEAFGSVLNAGNPFSQPSTQYIRTEDGNFKPVSTDEVRVKEYAEASSDEIAHDLANGLDSNWSKAAKIDILREARSEDGAYSVRDLARTIMANHDVYSEKDGNPLYKIDYENADPQTRIAIDALREDESMSKSFYRADDGGIIFEPNYLDRIKDKALPKYATSVAWEKQVVSDAEGNPIGYVERQGEQGVWESLANTLSSAGYQSMKFLDDHMVKPMIEKGLMSIMDTAASELDSEEIRQFKHNIEAGYHDKWRENLDTEITQQMDYDGPGDLLPIATAWATPFVAYLYTAGKIGNAGLKVPSKFLGQASKVRKKASAEAASILLRPPKHSKIKLAGKKLARSAEKSEQWNSYGRFMLGSIPLEASGGDQWSVFGTGLADMISDATFGDNVDLETRYKTSERMTQVGMDVLGVEAVALLADNLLLGLPKFAGSYLKYWRGNKSTGRTFVSNSEGFAKVNKPEFASESTRFFHNMFNGLQDQAIDELPESIANRVAGRGILNNPGEVKGINDAVTRFTDEAGDIFSNAKETIRNSIREYDKQFGGSVRMSEEQIERRTKKVYEEFMDKTAENLAGFLKNTSDDTNLPFKIADRLIAQAPRFKGQVPYASINGPKRLMTRAEANDLASFSYRYVVKPAEGGDYARVFEIEDGLWTTQLANRLRQKAAKNSPEEILERQAQASGLGPAQSIGPNDEEFSQLDRMARNIEEVYGQEVEIDGLRGHIVDFDKDGFVVRDADGTLHKSVKIETLDDLIQENLGTSQYSEHLDDLVEGGQAVLTGRQVDDIQREATRVGNINYIGLTRDARNLLKNLDQENTTPAFITNRLKRIARDNGIEVKDADTPRAVITKLREKGFSKTTKKALDKVGKADDMMRAFKDHPNSTRVVRSSGDEVFEKVGLGKKFMDHINEFAGYANRSASTARKFVKLLGTDNTDGLHKMVKNLKDITRWNPSKVGDDGINANRGFLFNNNGTDEHFINVKKVHAEDTPRVWDMDENGRLTFNDKWRRVEPNQTIQKDGTLPLYTREEIGSENWYRPASQGEEGVFINVQNPTKNEGVTTKEVYSEGIDAVEKKINGVTHYRLVNEGQQTIDPTKIKKRRAKIYNTNTTVKKPSKKEIEEVKKEAQDVIGGKLEQAGFGRAVAYGLAGSIADNMIGTTAGDEEGYKFGLFSVLGALAGSRRIRTKTSNLIDGFTSKPVKNIFSKKASATYEADKSIRNAKERELHGFFVNDDNDRTVEMANDVIRQLKGLGDSAVASWENFRNSDFARSSFMWLQRLDIPAAKRLLVGLERINETVNQIASIPRTNFAARIQSLKTNGRIPENAYKNITDAYDVFRNERGPAIIKDAFPDREITDARAQEQLELAVFRNRFGKTRLEDGKLKWHENPTTKRMYDKPGMGEIYKEIDRALLRSPEFQAFMDAKATWFDNVKDEWMRQIDGRITTRVNAIDDKRDKELLQNLINTDVSYGQWRSNLNDADAKRITELYKNDKNVKRLIGYHNTRSKFTNLEEGYYPQMISSTRSETAFHRFVRDNNIQGMSEKEQREQFNKYYAKEMYKMNTSEPSRRVLKKYDPDGEQFDTYYGSRAEMRGELDKLSSALMDKPEYEELGSRIARNKDEFLQKKQVKQYDDEGNIKLDDEGNAITEERYYLQAPDNMEINPFEIQDTYFKGNIGHFRGFYDDLMMGNIVKESNFLERPRVKYIPDEFLEIGLDDIRRRYSTDVGRRIHDARYGMFDEEELWNNYLDDIFRFAREEHGLKRQDVADMKDRILSIYNYAHGNLNKTGREIRKQAKWKRVVDNFKNALFGRFGYGFSWYNSFEYMVVGPHISSYDSVKGTLKLFTMNKQALDNTESLLRSWDIVRREIGSVNPDFERYGNLAGDQVTGLWTNRMNKVANYSADFSVAKNIGGKIFGWDVRDWGMARINPFFGDSFLGTNFVSSAINAQAALGEVRHLARIAKELEKMPKGKRFTKVDGKTWTYGDVRRKLGELGINEDRYDRFLNNVDKFDELVERIRGTEEIDISTIAQREMPEHVNDVFHVMQRATESFHGTNKLYRPETWHSPLGKALSTYSTYPFNFAMQTVNRRVRQPIKDWWTQYGKEQLGEEAQTRNAMKMLWNLKKGDIDKLKGMGLSSEAIENIPVDAYRSILKHFRTLGIGTAGYLTMDAVNDTMAYPMNDAVGGEQWKRLNRWKVLNPGAPQADQVTWNDIDGDIGIENFMNILHYSLGIASRGSLFGRYGDIIQRQYSLSRDGVMSLTPMTDMVNGSFKGAMDITRKPVVDWPKDLSNKGKRFLINNTPILGSGIFGELRKGIYEQVRLKEEDDKSLRFQSEETGAMMDIEDINSELE